MFTFTQAFSVICFLHILKLLCTYGGRANTKSIAAVAREKSAVIAGEFGCRGFDTFGPFKLIGGIAKGRPSQADLENARRFFEGLCK